jgi:DNA-binding SARP family transcriptional activator/Flp pilus assembly protein TadD
MNSPLFRLKLFGNPALLRSDGSLIVGKVAQRHRLALLALLARAPGSRLSREKLVGYLWPEADPDRGRNLLNVSTYVVRASLTDLALISEGEDLRLNADLVTSDAADFEAALERNDLEEATTLYSAPFLDGFFISGAQDFEQWVSRERQRLGDLYAAALEKLAGAAEASGDVDRCVHWWSVRAAHDPFDSRVALRLMEALASSGNKAGALSRARSHERLLRDEFGVSVPREISAFVERLRQSSEDPPLPRINHAGAIERNPPEALVEKVESSTVDLSPRGGVTRKPVWRRWAASAAMFVFVVAGIVAWQVAARPANAAGSAEARELYRRGRYLWSLRTKEGHLQAIDYYQQAISRDSAFAAPWAGLAETYLSGYQQGILRLSEDEAFSRIKWAAERALALDEKSAEAHVALGVVRWWQRDWAGADGQLRRAIALDANNAVAHTYYSVLLSGIGRSDEAVRESRRGYELEPFSSHVSLTYAWQCRLARDYDCAIRQYQRTLELNSLWAFTWDGLGLAYAGKGMHDQAIRAMERAIELSPKAAYTHVDLAYVYAKFGEAKQSREILLKWKGPYVEPFNVARAYVALGEADSAFAWLEKSTWAWPHRALRIEPALDPIRSDPRFAALSAKIDRDVGLATGRSSLVTK